MQINGNLKEPLLVLSCIKVRRKIRILYALFSQYWQYESKRNNNNS